MDIEVFPAETCSSAYTRSIIWKGKPVPLKTSARIAAACGVLIAACSSHARAQDALTVAVGGRGIGEACVTEIGSNAGIFAKHGLKLEIVYTDGGGETQQAVISGSAQIGVTSGLLGALGLYSKGAPVRIIGATYTGGRQVFWYVPASSPIVKPTDLAGKTVAYSNNSSASHVGLLALQRHFNVALKPTQTGNAAATLTATMSGQIDAGWAGAPFALDALEEGKIRLVMKSSDAPDFDKQTGRVVIANANELTRRPDVLVRYMRAYRDTLDWIYDTPEGFKAYAAFSSLSARTARRALDEFLPRHATNPDRISGLEEAMADAVTFKFMAAPLTKEQLADLIRIPEPRGSSR
jgi:NitT/TauT family transport system substrate-binding protein